MAYFERTRDAAAQDLREQITLLSRQLAALQKSMKKEGHTAYAENHERVAEFYDDIAARLHDALPRLRDKASQAERLARANPTATTLLLGAALAGLTLVFLSRR